MFEGLLVQERLREGDDDRIRAAIDTGQMGGDGIALSDGYRHRVLQVGRRKEGIFGAESCIGLDRPANLSYYEGEMLLKKVSPPERSHFGFVSSEQASERAWRLGVGAEGHIPVVVGP